MTANLDQAEVVIIGGGILGLSLAYQLGRLGVRDVVILEKDHLCAGASARCGGGVRQQWSTPENIEWAKQSVRMFADLPSELGINIWFLQTGYLFLASNKQQVELFEKNIKVQNEHGVPTRLLEPVEVSRLAPELDISRIVAGAFNPSDGHLFPFSVIWGYAKACRRTGMRIHTHTQVTSLEARNGRITKAITANGGVSANTLVNACGAWSPEIARHVEVDLPNQPEKHEILVTEPLAPFLKPAVIPIDSGLYCSQTARGELCACVGLPKKPKPDYLASFEFTKYISTILIELFPNLAEVKILRQWAGYYDLTPDTQPILGPVDQFENFIQLHGFMGHGFMMAPYWGKTMAEFIVKKKHRDKIEPYRLERFKEGALTHETMIIG